MHVDVPGPEVLLHHHLVLLCVPAAEDQVVLRRDEPVELLEPVHPARHLEAALVRLFVFRCVKGVCAVLNWCCTFLDITLLSIDRVLTGVCGCCCSVLVWGTGYVSANATMHVTHDPFNRPCPTSRPLGKHKQTSTLLLLRLHRPYHRGDTRLAPKSDRNTHCQHKRTTA